MKIENLTLTQEAFLDTLHQGSYMSQDVYSAHAIDKDENEYIVHWGIKEGYEDWDDESAKCDWDNPMLITKL